MRLTSELTVDAPLERTWPALIELGGPVRLDLGGEYRGTARLDDADEDEHEAGFHAQARETAGHGLAAATIAARLSESDGATRIAVETDLRLAGGSAQPDQEGLQRAVEELLAGLAGRLSREASAPAIEPGAATQPAEADSAWEHPETDRTVADLARELLATEGDPPPPEPIAKPEPPPLKGSDPYPPEPLKRSDPSDVDVWVGAGRVAERSLLVVLGTIIGVVLGRLLWRRE
jgi:carbon monoxide dehydrogenase subunit G